MSGNAIGRLTPYHVLVFILKVLDHAHDRNLSLNAIIHKHGAHNSFDRWHIARSAAREMKAISSGTQKNKGVTWHPELADKVSRMRNHLYWAMDNCNGDEATLRHHLDCAVEHFQMRHNGCDESSICRQAGYAPDYIVLTDPVAVTLLKKFIQRSAIYRKPSDYVHGRDTYLVESYNNVALIYLDKRIHYSDHTYEMRRNLAVLDWNEHVSRDYSSVWYAWSHGNRNEGRAKRQYKPKSYAFVNNIWSALTAAMSHNDVDVEASSPCSAASSSDATINYFMQSSDASSCESDNDASSV